MKEIELTNAQMMIVDDEDYEYLTNNYGKFQDKGTKVNTIKKVNGKSIHLEVSRIILNRFQTIPSSYEISYKDGNHLNNQKNNLKIIVRELESTSGHKRSYLCPMCGENYRYNGGPYCKPCFNEYNRKRRKNNPELKKQATEYKREYRRRKKEERGTK